MIIEHIQNKMSTPNDIEDQNEVAAEKNEETETDEEKEEIEDEIDYLSVIALNRYPLESDLAAIEDLEEKLERHDELYEENEEINLLLQKEDSNKSLVELDAMLLSDLHSEQLRDQLCEQRREHLRDKLREQRREKLREQIRSRDNVHLDNFRLERKRLRSELQEEFYQQISKQIEIQLRKQRDEGKLLRMQLRKRLRDE